MNNVKDINERIKELKSNDNSNFSSKDISDGYHTFGELYHHRAVLTASLFNQFPEHCWKSKQHHVGGEPMFEDMFIVGIDTPKGQATYHYHIDPYWDMFNIKELDNAKEWDGHTSDEAISRIESMFTTKKLWEL